MPTRIPNANAILSAACALALTFGCGSRPPAVVAPPPVPPTASAPIVGLDDHVSAEALRADFRDLVRILEDSHPDPYIGGGGRVAFHRRARAVLDAIPEGGSTPRRFLQQVRPFVAAVKDAHTGVWGETDSARRLPLRLMAIDDLLYVTEVFAEEHKTALNASIESVEGVPWTDLVERMKAFRGYDNAYGNLENVSRTIRWTGELETFLGRNAPLTNVRIGLRTPNDESLSVTFPVVETLPETSFTPDSAIVLPPLNAADFGWGFLTEDHSVAILRIDSLGFYRESLEGMRAAGLVEFLNEALGLTAELSEAELDARIAAVPSATELFRDLFAAMVRDNTRSLIVDLRENGGGNSYAAAMLEYFLYPLDEFLNSSGGYQVRRYSQLYFDTYRTDSIERVRSELGPHFEVGDFDFHNELEWYENQRNPTRFTADDVDYSDAPTFDREFQSREWSGRWRGNVVALSSPRTASAGFDVLTMLRGHGAKVVGVPSAQAGNCFIDILPFHLTRTGLTGVVSHKWSVTFPDQPELGEILRPDVELTYERLRAMNFDPNASVILALETLRAAEPTPLKMP